jgi:hypothetical protein
VSAQQVDLLGAGYVPQTDLLVPAAGGQQFAVRRKGEAANQSVVSFKSLPFLPRGRVPETDELIAAAGSQQLAVGREPDATGIRLPEAYRPQPGNDSRGERVAVAIGPPRFRPFPLGRHL